MTRKDEIKQLKMDLTKVRRAMTLLELQEGMMTETIESLESLSDTPMRDAMETVQEAPKSLSNAVFALSQLVDYYLSRIATLERVEREEKYGMRETRKLKQGIEKLKKAKAEQIRYESGASDNQFKVFVGDKYVGTVRRSKIKYQSGTEVRFSEEAVKSRKFVKDGKLDIQEIAKFSQSRFTLWKYGKNDKGFQDYEEAARAMIAEKLPMTKVQ